MSVKEELRRRLKTASRALSSSEVDANSAVIVEQLERLIVASKPTVVHCFEPIKSKREVNISPLLAFLQSRQPAPTLYTSRKIDGWWHVVSLDGEPVHRQPRFDCVIVPMIGFDGQSLHRLGNGGGYYDRMLSKQAGAFKVGVCFEVGKITDFPATAHDIPLDCVITEKQMYIRPGADRLPDSIKD